MKKKKLDGVIHYVVGFSIKESSGKAKATREKASALKNQVSEFRFFCKKSDSDPIPVALRYLISLTTGRVEKPDVLILRVYFPLLLSIIAHVSGIPVVGEVHTRGLDSAQRFRKSNPLKYAALVYTSYTEIIASKLWDGIIFNHPKLKDYWLSHYWTECPSISVYNGSSPDKYYIEEQGKVRKRLGINPDHTVLLFLGSVSPWHGVEYITKAAPYPDGVKVYIVGGRGGHYESLKKAYSGESSLVFVGRVSNDEARDFMNAADVCLLPVKDSRVSPGSPLKLYDYLMCGREVWTQVGVEGYSDEVVKAKGGAVVDFHNSNNIHAIIDQWLSTDQTQSREKIRQYAVDHYSWEARIEEWLQFINRVDQTERD